MGDELRGENLVHLNVRFSTETELKAIAALASIGFNSSPFIGNKTPAANGIPITLYINAQNKF